MIRSLPVVLLFAFLCNPTPVLSQTRITFTSKYDGHSRNYSLIRKVRVSLRNGTQTKWMYIDSLHQGHLYCRNNRFNLDSISFIMIKYPRKAGTALLMLPTLLCVKYIIDIEGKEHYPEALVYGILLGGATSPLFFYSANRLVMKYPRYHLNEWRIAVHDKK